VGLALECASIVFLLSIADVFVRKRSYALDLVMYSAISLLMLGNVMYVSVFSAVANPRMLSVVGQLRDVSSDVSSLLRPVYLLYVADIPVLGLWALLTWGQRRAGEDRARKNTTLVAAAALGVLVVQVALVLLVPAELDGAAVARVQGFAPYQIGTIVRLALPDTSSSASAAFAHEKSMTPSQAAQAQIDSIRHGDQGARIGAVQHGQYRGTNVIVIQVEALQDFVVGRTYAGKQITPNLNKLASQSWYFPYTYSETSGGNTVDAEFTVNTSLFAPANSVASVEYGDRDLHGLPAVLRDQGYDAITLHANDVRFWNRINLYPSLGFRQYWDMSYFKNRDKMWHASDQVLFSDGMRVLKSEAASSAPFYSFFITESSHAPFVCIPMKRRPLRLSASDEKTVMGRYLGSISYTDMAIGEFVASLQASGLWDNSIVVIYGDHTAVQTPTLAGDDQRILEKVLGRPYSSVDRQRVPLIIHLPGQTTMQVSNKPVGQVDIMPTIADLVGADLSAAPHLGRSAFVNAPSLIPLRAYLPAGSFVDDTTLFTPGLSFDQGQAFSIVSGQAVAPSEAERSAYEASKRLSLISEAWVKSLPKRADAGSIKDAILP